MQAASSGDQLGEQDLQSPEALDLDVLPGEPGPDDIMECFSVPRLVPRAVRKGLRAYYSFDLLNGSDLLQFAIRSQVANLVKDGWGR